MTFSSPPLAPSPSGFEANGNCIRLVHINALIPQFSLGLLNLAQETFISLWCVVESDEAKAEGSERICAERNEEPPRELILVLQAIHDEEKGRTHHWQDVVGMFS